MTIKFGTDGWRAVISDQFIFSNVKLVAQAIAEYIGKNDLSKKGIVIGYDSRFLADKFAEETAKVMLSNGINCIMMDTDTPTPVVAFTVVDRKAAGAVMITASHNPPQYCGMKFITKDGGPAPSSVVNQIENNLKNNRDIIKGGIEGEIEHFNPFNRYLKHIRTIVDFDVIKNAKLSVVYDPLWGTGRNYFDKILKEAGCRVEMINGTRDVLFGGITPEPIGEHLTELKNKVKQLKAVLGLSTDPDSDRFGIIDEQGNYVGANDVISIVFRYLVEERREQGAVVRSVATTHMIDSIAKKNGIKVYETPVGFKYIAEIMLRENVIIGGEESGGLSISGHVPEKDGLLAGLLVCEMVARTGKPLSQILKDTVNKYGKFINKRVNMRLNEQAKRKLMELLSSSPLKQVAGSKLKDVSKIDGIKLLFSDGSWILARPSGTEELVRTYFEGESDEKVKKMIFDFENFVNSNIIS